MGVDSKDESQLNIAVNGGMGNMICTSIERYLPEIKTCVLTMIDEGALYLYPQKAFRRGFCMVQGAVSIVSITRDDLQRNDFSYVINQQM